MAEEKKEKDEVTVDVQIAAMLYWKEAKAAAGEGEKIVKFEEIETSLRDVFIKEAKDILVILNKLNLVVSKRGDVRTDPTTDFKERIKQKDKIEKIIMGFIPLLVTKKKPLINPQHFPAGELAYKIIDGV